MAEGRALRAERAKRKEFILQWGVEGDGYRGDGMRCKTSKSEVRLFPKLHHVIACTLELIYT